MATSEASRRLINELATMLDKKIRVILESGRKYEGQLVGFDHPALNILLKNAVDSDGVRYPKIIIKGEKISEIVMLEESLFDLEEFKEFLLKEMKLQEHAVRVLHDIRALEILGRYKVSEEGVVGSGPMAETLYSLYKKYIEQHKKRISG